MVSSRPAGLHSETLSLKTKGMLSFFYIDFVSYYLIFFISFTRFLVESLEFSLYSVLSSVERIYFPPLLAKLFRTLKYYVANK